MQPVLSILIPTYNRAECLDECLSALVRGLASAVATEVEILISDNASTDGTQKVCERYVRDYPNSIVYVRQPENIGPSANFTFLIRQGRGKFLKFLNDRFAVEPDTVRRLIEIIKSHEAEHPLLYFGNDELFHLGDGVYPIRSFDELADTVSYWSTSIAGYGFWRDEVETVLPIQNEFAGTLLQQTAVIWKLFEKNRIGYLYNHRFHHGCKGPAPGGGYNVAKVFSQNYLGIIKPYLKDCKLSKAAYKREQKRLYFGHIYGMYFDFERNMGFDQSGFFRYTKDYWLRWYYWGSLLVVPIFYAIGALPRETRLKFWNAIRTMRRMICGR